MSGMDRFYQRQKEKEKAKETKSQPLSSGGMDRFYQKQHYNSLDTSAVNESYINTFVSDANNFFKTSENDDRAYSKWQDLSSRSETISAWLYKNRNNLDSKTYEGIANAVKTFGEATSGYSQYSSDEDYMKAVSGWLNPDAKTDEKTSSARQDYYENNKVRVEAIDKQLPWYVSGITPNFIEDIFLSDYEEARRDEMEQRNAENKQYERTQGALDKFYKPETPEFTQAASNRNHGNPTKEALNDYDVAVGNGSVALGSGGSYDEEGNILNRYGEIVTPANAPEIKDKLGLFLSASIDDIADALTTLNAKNGSSTDTWGKLMQEGNVNAWRELNDYEISLYYYYLNTEGQEKAYEFLEAMTTELTRRSTQEVTEAIEGASVPVQIALNIASIPMNVVGGAVGLGDNIANLAQGKDINPYSAAHIFSNAASAIREDTAKDIDAWTGGASIPWLDFSLGDAYQAGMSFADSALAALVPLGLGEVLLASGAATSTMKNMFERGATQGQMLTGGALSFAAEALFEHVSLGELKKLKNMDEKAVKNFFDGFVRSVVMGGVEASEEMATEIANTISDALVMGSQSEWVDFETFAQNVLNAGLGGFLSGAVGGGVASTVNNAQYQKYTQQKGQQIIDAGGVESLQKQVAGLKDNKTVSKLSEKVAYERSAKNVGKLADVVQSITSAKDKAAAVSELEEKGLSKKEAKKVADFVEKVSEGYEATAEETAEIEKITDKLPDIADNADVTADASTTIENNNAADGEATNSTENISKTENEAEAAFEASDADVAKEEASNALAVASEKYGAQAGAMVHTYIEGQDVAEYDAAYQIAYNMGKSGVSLSYAMSSESTSYLTEEQRQIAHETGAKASDSEASAKDTENKKAANGKTSRRIGTVKGEGVTISDLKAAFNDTQNTAYKILSTYAATTGIDIVLFKSEANENGHFEGAQGKFKWKEDTIYIDINAGLANIYGVEDLAQYAMVRTFSHEFTHFLEKWNPVRYNEFRKVVFDTLTERGENVEGLIAEKLEQDESGKMTYDEASREVVAEAMTDILPDANFVQELAENHKSIFGKLLEKLKAFVSDLKAYFSSLGENRSREAKALKEQVGDAVHYVESIVKLFDKVAVEAVETYQKTVATEAKAALSAAETASTVTDIADKNESLQQNDHVEKDDSPFYDINAKFDDKVKQIPKEDVDAGAIKAIDNYHLNEDEVSGIKGYVDGKAYELTRLQRAGDMAEWTEFERYLADGITSGLLKHPQYAGRTYRNLEFGTVFDDEAAYNNFIEENSVGREVVLKAFTSASKNPNGYPVSGERIVHLVIDGLSARDISETLNLYQEEVVYLPGTKYVVTSVTVANDGHPLIYAKEVSNNEVQELRGSSESGGLHKRAEGILEGQGNDSHGVFNNGGKQVSGNESSEVQVLRSDVLHVGRSEQEVKDSSEETKQEVNQNGENADNQAAVSQPNTDRQRDSRILDEVETGDVSRDAPRGDTLDDAVQRERETARNDNTDDAGRSERGHGEGSGESADLRRDDGLTPEEASKKAEQLHEEVKEQIEQQSTETPKGRNFVIGDSLSLPNGEKARYKVNVAAIRLVKKLEAEGRYATEFEQTLLSKYVGWGGLANAFDERKADWSAEYKELKELLTDEEYKAARGSTLNAHYTDISVIKAMYDGLAKLGFDGGRMLEPSSGVGNFVGAMPAEMSAKVKSWTMVELDNITGLIAKYLYPNADVRIQGFEKANIPNNFMDVAISNVPFGNFPITDKAYPKKVTSAIHNYFFAKTLDKVRPGGLVMFITSSYTMNSKDSTVRRYIMQRADLLGAIRLPDTAFKGNAGTEVVTDILILKKREANTPYAGEDFLEAPYKYINGYNGAHINSYFNNHPEMVLGTPSMDGGMYRGGSLTYKALEGKGSLADQIREAFTHINGKMDYTAAITPEKTNFAVERASKKTKQNGFVSKEGKIFQNQDGSLVPVEVNAKVAERITGMLEIRDAAKNLLNYQQQGVKDSEIKKARQTLNKLYDAYVKKYGFLNANANKRAFKEDPDCYSLFALENWDNEKKKATKADIFSKNTVSPNRTVTTAKDVPEGLIVSVNQTGGVDAALIARLTGKTEDDVTRELIDSRLAYKNRNGALETAERYLSGNVRAKLRDAEAMAPMDADYQKNVEALKAIVPKDVSYQEIAVQPGTPWIPNSVYSDFAAYMLGGRNTEWRQDVDVTRNPETGNFTVELKGGHLKHNANNTQRWGTPRRSFLDLFDSMLNSKSVVVKIKLDDGTSIVDKDATAAANEKIENITKEFSEWLWKDEARRTELTELYNEVFNSIVTPKYDGDNLTVNGANAMKPLRPHQRDAVQRIIASGGNTLLAHKVGAGKTYEMAAAAMKLKELGLVKKPMFAVPKSLVAQWGNEFIDFFPTAKLLVAEAGDFTESNRKTFMNRIANGDYDAVIVSYEQFERLPMSDDFTRELYQEQIDSIVAAIEEAKAEKGGKSLSVKDLEKKRKSLQAKIDKLTDSAKDEGNIDFEELGVDSLFIDEAHNFKNLFYTTSMTNVSGLGNKDGAKRSFDLYTKVRYLQKLNGGRGIVFATATPVMNSMSEMYIMQKYLQPDVLNQLGLSTFDAWAKQFGEVVNGVEIKPSGQGYRIKQSFSRFKNMSELQLLFRNFADVLTDVPGLKIPKMKGGKVNVVVCEPGQYQKDYMKELEKRADNVKNVDPSVDNMLKITSDGRKISYTQRMIDPSLPYEEGCKIYRCADNVVKAYGESADVKGTQLIFCDMATPKGKSKTETTDADTDSGMDMESARLYDDIKARLIEGGIPAKEIAFIHEADTDQKKKKLFADVNEGKVRVLIGSTGKMGVGMNAQKRIVAIHHLDAPWRPGDVEQRNGRAYRQGNINEEVECFTYVTEGSFDARLWDILERKQNFINQIMNGENIGRETEDTGEVTLSAAEVKALASGSPLIMEQVQLDTDIKKLESLQRAHRSAIRSASDKLQMDKGTIDILKRKIAGGKADIAATVDTYSEGKFSINIGKQKFTDKKEAGVALVAEATAKATVQSYVSIGTFAGFEMRVIKTAEGIKGVLQGKQSYPFNIYPNNTTFGITHLISTVESISETVKKWDTQLKATEADLAEQEKLINEPFAKQAELDSKRLRFKEVMDILNPKEEQSAASLDDEKVQEQSRAYLGEEQNQQRIATLTDREVLELAAKDIKVSDLSEAEANALGIFEERLGKLKKLQEERAEKGRLYKDQQFGAKVDRNAASETLNRIKVLDEQIKRATADVLTVEEKEVLKTVLQKARKVVEVHERQHGKELLDRWRERNKNAVAIKKYRDRLRGDVDELTNWIRHPDNKNTMKHVPDVLKNTVIPFLSSINFMSKRSLKGGDATISDNEFIENLNALKSALKINIDVYGMYSGYNDLPQDFMERLQTFIDSAQALVNKSEGEFIINKMTSVELKELSQIVRTLKKYIMQINRFHNNAMYQHVYEAGDDSINFLVGLDNAGSHVGKIANFLLWQQMRPAYAFERFGEGGQAIYDELRRGQAKLAFNTKEIQSFTETAYSAKEVNAWEEEIKEFSLGGDIVRIPVSGIMSLYELSKDPEAIEHIYGGGIRVATYTHKGKKISDVGHTITHTDLMTIIKALTPRQAEVADSLQKYMASQGAKWGNHVSVARFGEELFTKEHYFPINSDGRHLQATADEQPEGAALYALLNMSFTKARKEGANNRIVIYSIFDVFANHMASMAQYNAMALPVLDALKWFNYQQVAVEEDGSKTVLGSVRDQMNRVYGVADETRPGSGKKGYAELFVANIIKAFNGTEAQGTPYDTFALKSLRRYNMAQVAYNLRVVVQQPLAITRAAQLIDYSSIMKGLKLKPAAMQKNIEEMQKYSGIAAWKSLGFYDVNISRGLTSLIKHDTSFMDKVGDVGMWGAEKADLLAWASMWSACKEEVTKKEYLSPESKGFYEAVTKLFEDVIYKTQVVDSVLTKNEFMRDKGFAARAIGSFMSEPTTTASMVIDSIFKFYLDIKRGMTRQQAWQKNRRQIGRMLYVYGVSAIILAAVQAAADALRDDDEYETYPEKWLDAFVGNIIDELMPFNKLPIVSDFYEFGKSMLEKIGVDTYGNPPQTLYMQWRDSMVKGVEIIYDKISGEDTNYTWYGGISKLLQAVSGMTGLPMAAATREIITFWNNSVGAMAPSLKVMTYEPSELSKVRYAYEDGWLTAEEATAILLEKELADTADEAYFIIQGWEAGNGYSRYDAIYDAVRNNGSIDAAMGDLISHGYTEKHVLSQVKGKIGEWYKSGEVTKQQAIAMLQKYTSMSDDEITKAMNKWSSVVVTGVEYDDIADEFMEGNITASRAVDMYMRYGSMTKEKALEKVDALQFIKQNPSCEDITAAAVASYREYCEGVGLDPVLYYEAWQYKNGLSGSGEVKEKMMVYINRLPISAAQKDSLYFAFGWAKSKLYEAPWR